MSITSPIKNDKFPIKISDLSNTKRIPRKNAPNEANRKPIPISKVLAFHEYNTFIIVEEVHEFFVFKKIKIIILYINTSIQSILFSNWEFKYGL